MNYRQLALALFAVVSLQVYSSAQEKSVAKVETFRVPTSTARPPKMGLHPLEKVLKVARQHQRYMRNTLTDYTCYLVKRERIDGELLPTEHMFVKFRSPRETDEKQTPFSVYLKVLAPKRSKGREILYVDGANEGDVVVRKGGRRSSFLTLRVSPDGKLAMRDNKYPVTAFGLENLVARLIEVAERDVLFDECAVRVVENAKVDDRDCTVYEVKHPKPRSHFRFHIARVFIDRELQLPIRYAAYDWPEDIGQEPPLLEEYTYRNLKLNVGLTDADFDSKNPEYGFSERQ